MTRKFFVVGGDSTREVSSPPAVHSDGHNGVVALRKNRQIPQLTALSREHRFDGNRGNRITTYNVDGESDILFRPDEVVRAAHEYQFQLSGIIANFSDQSVAHVNRCALKVGKVGDSEAHDNVVVVEEITTPDVNTNVNRFNLRTATTQVIISQCHFGYL